MEKRYQVKFANGVKFSTYAESVDDAKLVAIESVMGITGTQSPEGLSEITDVVLIPSDEDNDKT